MKKIGRIEALLHKKLVCLEPRLKRRYGLLIYPEGPTVKAIKETKEDIKNFIKHGDAEDAEVEYIGKAEIMTFYTTRGHRSPLKKST